MKVLEYLNTFVDDFKAHRRGESRVAERGLRGRVYAKAGDEAQSTSFTTKKTPTATLTMTVHRANGSTETITVPSKVLTTNG